ncbi:MAG TPA: IclR family transcriptional regulator [Terriglobales bacterium]|nr:IclR family transcriptional regulator [Terriglobales bacterium]
MTNQNGNPSTAVERTILILEAVGQREGGMSNADFHRKLKIPKSSASYILRTLEQHGYVRRDLDSGKYRLGMKVVSLARAALGGVEVREVALPIMRHLVDHIHLTTHLAILDHEEAVYVEKVEEPSFIKMDTWIGRRMEVHSTAVGKALLAYLDPEERETIIRHRGMKKLTPHTITSMAKLMKEFERVRQLGYSVDDEENSLGARCVGAPIFNSQGQVEASLGSTGTITDVPRDAVPRLAQIVKDAARRISHRIGYRGPYPRPG